MERGFIRAEVVPWDKFLEYGSFAAARDRGAASMQGRDYQVIDGDVILFRFS
jgi:ribosome-binding ATPase YchF (GTP1/OBG family)